MPASIGAHISKRKSYKDTFHAITQAGGNAIQIFSGSPRSSSPKDPKDPKYSIRDIDSNLHIIIHAPYTINPAMPPKNNKRNIDICDTYWFQCIIAELSIADIMGAVGVVFHVGKHTTQTVQEGLSNMKNYIHTVLQKMTEMGIHAKLILETASGQGTELLSDIDDLCFFYNEIVSTGIEYKDLFGLCFDTCHVWSCGYNLLNAYSKIQDATNNAIACIHLNGSATPKGSRKDRHAMLHDENSSIPLIEINELMQHVVDAVVILETPDETDLDGEIRRIQEISKIM